MMTEARKAWEKENKHRFSINFMKRSEADIIEFLERKQEEGQPKGTTIKQALRLLMDQEKQQEGKQ
jgi:predicted Rdx family selenoprotein